LALYKEASSHALSHGLILADTKFEFGLVSSEPNSPKQLILIDEVLTPDSSRFWPADGYEAGKPQPSFDKQFLRDWLVSVGYQKGLEGGVDGNGWVIDEVIVTKTKDKYEEAIRKLTS
jgi:phosphoribosylaminoimidazole-succinocarboxamide synthase